MRVDASWIKQPVYALYPSKVNDMSSHPPRDTLNTRISTSRDGTRIYADAIGDSTKPAIVFVHGFSFCTLVFDKLFLETKLSREFFLVSLYSSTTSDIV